MELSGDIKRGTAGKYAAIHPIEKKEYYVLSSAQQRLYILNSMHAKSTNYNLPQLLHFRGKADRKRIESTFKTIIARHEILRTSFKMVGKEAVQCLHPDVDFLVEYRAAAAPARTEKTEAGKEDPANLPGNFVRPFDLSKAPLLRALLVTGEDNKNVLLLDLHHIVTDGRSQFYLEKEFLSLYTNPEEKLPVSRLQYKDFARWQNDRKQTELMKQQEIFWAKRYPDELPILILPTDYPRPPVQSIAGASVRFTLAKRETQQVKKISDKLNITPYMAVLTAISILLSKLSGREDIIVGSPIQGRSHIDLEGIIGMFVNMITMRCYPADDKICRELLEEVKQDALDAFENQEYQFEDLVDKISVRRDTGRNPIFDVVLNMLHQSDLSGEASFLKEMENVCENEHRPGTSKFDLTFGVVDCKDRIYFSLEYCTALFKAATIDKFIVYLKNIFKQLFGNIEQKLSSIELITGEEKKQVLNRLNDAVADYPKNKVIHESFREQVNKTPGNVALVFAGEQLTYRELDEMSDRSSRELRAIGVEPGSIVGIMMDKSLEMIIGILAALKAGGAYMPVDPDYPEARIRYMLKDSGVGICLTTPDLAAKSGYIDTKPEKWAGKVIFIEKIGINRPAGEISEKINKSEEKLRTVSRVSEKTAALAYIIYTSGTTGKPKGSMIEHGNVISLLFNDNFNLLFDFSSRDIWTMFHSFCFDFSVWEMYGSLLYGGKLIIIPGMTAKDPQKFLEILKLRKVTVLNQTPTAFYNLSNCEAAENSKGLQIRYIIFGGEELKPSRLRAWHDKYPEVKLVNMYGITETTVHVTYREITGKEIAAGVSVVGKSLPAANIYLMDKYFNYVPTGVPGELFIGGAGVCRGYLGRPELTNEKFIDNPGEHEERLYRSGDLARILEDGELEYLGRLDAQVQIRGFRIELGEIACRLQEHSEIKEAVVLAKVEKDVSLRAYYSSKNKLSPTELREHLSKSIPSYMMPHYFVRVDSLPLTANGKINKKALPEPKILKEEDYIAPKTAQEKRVVGIWSEILSITKEAISVNANFFDLGGDSLKIVRLQKELEELLRIEIPLVELFTYPTIGLFLDYLGKTGDGGAATIDAVTQEKLNEVKESLEDSIGIFDSL
jgi:amino acid adenylation domain-containing protein